MRVTVLMGGDSDERDVSLVSGVEVAAALRKAGHDVVALDTLNGPLTAEEESGLLESGVASAPPSEIERALRTLDVARHEATTGADVVFLALHGGQGEDGTVQALLELAEVTYAGSGMLGCALAMDKDVSKRLFREAGIPTPDWVMATEPAQVLASLDLPVIVKPVSGGSSVHLTRADDRSSLERALGAGADVELSMMAEVMVQGREFTVGVVGGQALPVGEIISQHELFDYECKYQPGMAEEVFPASIPSDLASELQSLALRAHDLLRLRDFARVDFMVDGSGRPWCLEANALPGLTANSLLPKAALAAGMDFPDLCDRIVKMALTRRHYVK